MSNKQFAKLATNKRNLTSAQKGKNFVSLVYDDKIPYLESNITAPTVGQIATTFSCIPNGFPVDLHEGTRIQAKADWLGTTIYANEPLYYFIVREFTPAGTAIIPIEPIMVTEIIRVISNQPSARIYAYIPFFSCEQFSNDETAEVIKGNNFSDGLRPEKAVVTIDGTASSSGGWVYDDPGFKEVRKAYKQGRNIYYEHLFAYLRGGIGFEAYVTQNGRSANRNEFVQANNQYEIVGDTVDIPTLASVFS